MVKLLVNIISAILGLWLAVLLVPGVQAEISTGSSVLGVVMDDKWKLFLFFGLLMGLANFFVSRGLFALLGSILTLWALAYFSEEISAPLWLPLLEAGSIIWLTRFIALKILKI